MRIQIVSDVHLEFGPLAPPSEAADVLIAAGDIGVGEKGLAWLRACPSPVIYVAGNHEYWGQDLVDLNERLTRLTRAGNIRFLENATTELDGVRFLGCTLWTDFRGQDPAIMQQMQFVMNDFRYVSLDGRSLRPGDLAARNAQSRAWLETELARPYGGKTVVVTHHTPLMRSWFYGRRDETQYAYCNDLGALMSAHPIDLWVHGHVHEAFDYVEHGVRVVCNPRGYYDHREVDDFDPGKCITL